MHKLKIKKNIQLGKITTMGIGGPAKFFVEAGTELELVRALDFAKKKKLPWRIIGDGSNLIPSDKGFSGLIIQNKITRSKRNKLCMEVGAGNNLLQLVKRLNKLGLGGIERMAGIPGTVGGAIYGSAGAYGNEMKDVLEKVRFYDGKKFRWIKKKYCGFGYRTSIFKKNKNWVIVAAVLRLRAGKRRELEKVSRDIVELRLKKYPKSLKCPGSFFQNVKLSDLGKVLRRSFLKKIPRNKIMFGKVPVGYLLEEVGARGMREKSVQVARHHGNLIFNPGQGKAADVKNLSTKLKKLVKKRFGIIIEEEVQYL